MPVERKLVPETQEREEISGIQRIEGLGSDIDERRKALDETGGSRLVSSMEGTTLSEEDLADLRTEALERLSDISVRADRAAEAAKKGMMDAIRRKFRESQMAKALLVAVGLHVVPLAPIVGEKAEEKILELVEDAWEKYGMVLHVQTEAEQKATTERVAAREARTDQQKLAAYEEAMDRRLSRGERVSLKRLYFDLERLHGVEPEVVKQGEKNADAMIEKYFQESHGKITEEFLQNMTKEMFGSPEKGVWSQASVSRYFTEGTHNCVAIDHAQQIVLEGVLDKLSPWERMRWHIGNAFEKDHEIATVTSFSDARTIDTTYYLELPYRNIKGAMERPGSPTIPLEAMKRAFVSPEPISIQSPHKKGEKIIGGPDIDAVTDQPVPMRVRISGPLVASQYNRTVAEQRHIIPVERPPKPKEVLVELHLGEWEKAPEQTLDDVKKMEKEAVGMETTVILRDRLTNPTPDAAREVAAQGQVIWNNVLQLGDLKGWRKESIDKIWTGNATTIKIEYDRGSGIPSAVFDSLQKLNTTDMQGYSHGSEGSWANYLQQLELENSVADPLTNPHLRSEDLKKLLESVLGKIPMIVLDNYSNIDEDDVQILVDSPFKQGITIKGDKVEDEKWERLSKAKNVELYVDDYIDIAARNPKLKTYLNIHPVDKD